MIVAEAPQYYPGVTGLGLAVLVTSISSPSRILVALHNRPPRDQVKLLHGKLAETITSLAETITSSVSFIGSRHDLFLSAETFRAREVCAVLQCGRYETRLNFP